MVFLKIYEQIFKRKIHNLAFFLSVFLFFLDKTEKKRKKAHTKTIFLNKYFEK